MNFETPKFDAGGDQPEQKYEDSAQKGDRLWAEFEKKREELRELHVLERKDHEAVMAIHTNIGALHAENIRAHEAFSHRLVIMGEEHSKKAEDIKNKWRDRLKIFQQIRMSLLAERARGRDIQQDALKVLDEFNTEEASVFSEAAMLNADFMGALSSLKADETTHIAEWNEKYSSIKSNLAGAQGDLTGTKSLVDSADKTVWELVRQLREVGEIEETN